MVFIISKASQSTEFIGWEKSTNGTQKQKKSLVIKGGAHVVNGKTMETPNGAVTEITSDDLTWLETLSGFKRMVAAGWLIVEKSKDKADKKAKKKDVNKDDETIKDGSAQLTEEDFEKAGQKAPIVGGADE